MNTRNRIPINNFSEQDAIYIAGLFDGEGSINLSKLSRKSKGEVGKTSTYLLRARIRMTDKNIVDWLRVTIGGCYYFYTASKRPNQKVCHEWNVSGRNAIDFIKRIYPYLKIKRLQADVAFKFGETIDKGDMYIQRLSDSVINLRQNCRDDMLVLNKRGLN